MDALWNNGVMTQQQLAYLIMKDKNSIVKLIDGLEKKGLVVRVADKVDRRQNKIELTEYASSIKEEVKNVAIEAINRIIKDIPQEEIETFLKVLGKMASNMNEGTDLLKI
jgi:DNA-binding MarR family transcriptional regulator